jgi:hypothetical protein
VTDPLTYPRVQHPTIAGLIVSGRLKPQPVPPPGRHADDRPGPQAVSVAQLLGKPVAEHTAAWFEQQLATADTVRIPRIVDTAEVTA